MTLLTWTRSGEMAAYRLSGTSRVILATILTFEALLTASVFTTSAALAAGTLTTSFISMTEVLLWILAGGTTWVLTASVGVVRSVAVSAAMLTRER